MSLQQQATPESVATLPLHNLNPPHPHRRPFRFWRRILGKDRPWASWRDSARAILFVSCVIPYFASVSSLAPRARGTCVNSHLLVSHRAECLSHLPSYRMGISLRRMVSWADLHTYVFIILFFFWSFSSMDSQTCFQ
jgi:hypothetical protein